MCPIMRYPVWDPGPGRMKFPRGVQNVSYNQVSYGGSGKVILLCGDSDYSILLDYKVLSFHFLCLSHCLTIMFCSPKSGFCSSVSQFIICVVIQLLQHIHYRLDMRSKGPLNFKIVFFYNTSVSPAYIADLSEQRLDWF